MIRLMIFILLIIIIGGCGPGSNYRGTPSLIATGVDTATPRPTLITATPTSYGKQLDTFQLLTALQVNDFVWKSDSEQVYYSVLGDASWWTYDLEKEENYLLGDDYPFDDHQGAPDLPYLVFDFGYSPSGEKGLFQVLLYPTPTIPPTVDGVLGGYTGEAELWYWENGQTRKLGIISSCTGGYLWSHGENRIVIKPDLRRGCDNMPISWMVDLNANSIEAMILEEGSRISWIENFSPNDQSLLYARDHRYSIIDVKTFEINELGTPDLYFLGGEWLNDDVLIFLVQEEFGDFPYRLALFNIETLEFTPLLDENYPEALEGASVVHYAVSPDKKWVAFSVGAFPWEVEGLWLLKLPE